MLNLLFIKENLINTLITKLTCMTLNRLETLYYCIIAPRNDNSHNFL